MLIPGLHQHTYKFLILISMLLTACSPSATNTITPPGQITVTPTAASTAGAAVAILQDTPTSLPTNIPLDCPVGSNAQTPAKPGTGELSAQLLNFLNEGGDPHTITALIGAWGFDEQAVSLVADLNSDQLPEFVFANAPIPQENGDFALGQISIYTCTQSQYTRAASFDLIGFERIKIFGIEYRTPQQYPVLILDQVDLRAAHNYDLVGWNGKDWQLYVNHTTKLGSFAATDGDMDGIAEFTIFAPLSWSVSGGPDRTTIVTYGWQNGNFTKLKQFLGPSTYRIHILEDAQIALDAGHFGEAIALYSVAANDPAFFDEPSDYEKSTGTEAFAGNYQKSFALFRITILWLAANDKNQAERTIVDSGNLYPPESPGGEFTEAALLFKKRVDLGDDFVTACSAVNEFLFTNYPNLSGLNGHLGYWGVANKYYDFYDLCPFK